MCGICGILSLSPDAPISESQLILMRDAMKHRGPDDAGLYMSEDGKIGLGHRRLSIIDLSKRGKQPMPNEDKTIWLAFNGEVYNYRSLQERLREGGHTFRSRTDAETIVHLYEEQGIDCVQCLRGMFAFALWDCKLRKLFLVRDRVGIKPLFYSAVANRFIFASEIQSIFKTDLVQKEINDQGVYDFLTILTVPAPETMFKNIYKLKAGTILEIDVSGAIKQYCYWDPATFLNAPLYSEDETTIFEKTEDLLEEAVHLRLISDVPVSATFSGGVDSSLIVSFVRTHNPSMKLLTIDYESHSQFNESEIAREIAHRLNVPLLVESVNEETYHRAINEYLRIQTDYPAGDPNTILLYLLSKKLKALATKVCLIGEGGDEIGGYPSYITVNSEYEYLKYFARLPAWVKRVLYALSPEAIRYRLELALGNRVVSKRHIHAFSEYEKQMMWCGAKVESTYLYFERIMEEVDTRTSDTFLRKILNLEFKMRLPELILPRVDYPTMANSIEARVPFLDHELVEYSLRLPMNAKMKNNEPKYILKKLLCNFVDPHFAYRKKIGFGMLLTPFFEHILPNWVKKEVLDNKEHCLFNYIDRGCLLRLYEAHFKNASAGFNLWVIYALGKWLEIHAEDE